MDIEREIIISSPSLKSELNDYYALRWQILRAPWGQDKGTEKDNLEENAVHRIALYNGKVVAVGRLHFINKSTSQIRYMAVKEGFGRMGIGTAILVALEQAAQDKNSQTIILHAREKAVGFYLTHGYQQVKKSHVLFNEIQHYEMHKELY